MNVLIIGGGLSGICLGHTLLNKGVDFKILDAGVNHSSKIAAGMINPMVFRKMVKTWKGDELIPFLNDFYPSIEEKIGAKFFFPRKIRRVFSTKDEMENWNKRLTDKDYEDYIHPYEESNPTPKYAINEFGSGWVKSPGYIDAKTFVRENQRYLIEKDKMIIESFDFDKFDAEKGTYKGKKYTHFIFSEGYKAIDNPYFNYLPFVLTKGEVLSIKNNELRRDEILNRKCFVLPAQDGTFKLGSTFEWDTIDTSPSENAKEQLLDQYKLLTTSPATIVDQEAGIRPTVADRRPLIGVHPEKENIFIFNGMGTKGYMLAPYFAEEFYHHLVDDTPLNSEVDIKRFYRKHFK
jgi:glycine/D-amino acid oxidase-like deaminating enzyme